MSEDTYDKNVDLPTPESPSRRMGTSGASSHAIGLDIVDVVLLRAIV